MCFSNICEALVTRPEMVPLQDLKSQDILFLNEVFKTGLISDFLECETQASLLQQTKVFSDKKITIAGLEINFFPNVYEAYHEKIVLTEGLKHARRIVSHLSEGQVEEFRIEFDDLYSSFIKFSHNGRGVITGFVHGDIYHINPCSIKR